MGLFRLILAVFLAVWLGISYAGAQQAPGSDNNASRSELEAELGELERQIDEYQGLIFDKQKEKISLERDIAILNAQISKAQLAIRQRNLAISRLSGEIGIKSQNIEELENEILTSRKALGKALELMREHDDLSVVEIAFIHRDVSRFFDALESFNKLQETIQVGLKELSGFKTSEEIAKSDFEERKREEIELIALQELERRTLAAAEKEKKGILEVTKGQEAAYQKVLAKTQKSASEIRARIFRLFGGGEPLSFGVAYELAAAVERETGVRAAFILAILTQESALDGIIGANLGQCFYSTPRNNASGTVMKNNQKEAFLKITDALGFDPASMPVSCPIVAHGAYGGAMGPAQFMPNTWLLYEKDISKVTGNKPPNPWNNFDAFAATGLYLNNSLDSATCRNYASENRHILPYQFLLERCAAAQYYAGGNWFRFRFAYGDPVAERTKELQSDIDVLNSLAQR